MFAGIAPCWCLHQGIQHWNLCKRRSPGYQDDDGEHTDDGTDDNTGIDGDHDFDDVADDEDDDDTDDDTNIDDEHDVTNLFLREVALHTEHLHNVPARNERAPTAFTLICWNNQIKHWISYNHLSITMYCDSVSSPFFSFLFRHEYIPYIWLLITLTVILCHRLTVHFPHLDQRHQWRSCLSWKLRKYLNIYSSSVSLFLYHIQYQIETKGIDENPAFPESSCKIYFGSTSSLLFHVAFFLDLFNSFFKVDCEVGDLCFCFFLLLFLFAPTIAW